ncbi:MAG: DMT family transporter [Alphaproteobacteria bacterium]|nr:DMT family transporter [Alphaproteobacteria bacterium]
MLQKYQRFIGISLGLLATISFGLTLPITRYLLLSGFSIWDAAIGRCLFAGVFALIVLIVTRQKLPAKKYLPHLFVLGLTVSLGFSTAVSYGMALASASNGSVILAGNSICIALFAILLAGEKPSRQFWMIAISGFVLIATFSYLVNGAVNVFSVYYGELAIFVAVIMAGYNHAQGAVFAKEIGGWQVICWAMAFSLPVVVPLSILLVDFTTITKNAWHFSNLLYVGIVNNCAIFVIWYHAMKLGGIAKTAQLKLLQPFVTFIAAMLFLSEPFNPMVVLFIAIIIILVVIAQRSHVGSHVTQKPYIK